jgi:hypothetical protein
MPLCNTIRAAEYEHVGQRTTAGKQNGKQNRLSNVTRPLEHSANSRKETPVKNLVVVFGTIVLVFGTISYAGVPFTNLEGVGGAAFNPFAYPANSGTAIKDGNGNDTIFSKPQIGGWYVNLHQAHINWTSVGIAETIGKRFEVSFANEDIQVGSPVNENFVKQDFGGKFLVLEENSFGDWSPAFSVGTIIKYTNPTFYSDASSSGHDFYAVATKFIKSGLPVPVLLSGGVRNTDSRVTGVLGYDDNRDNIFFGNIDAIVLKDVAVGFEYQEGPDFGNSNWKSADYYDIHVAWLINPNLSLIGAYVNTGSYNLSSDKFGLGDGVVASLQYTF